MNLIPFSVRSVTLKGVSVSKEDTKMLKSLSLSF